MDFHDMKRRELQKLCKEHDLPANLSNLDMAEKLSSLFKVKEKEEERPMRKTRSCLKNSDELLSENELDVLKRKSKKVRFSPQNDVFQLGEKNERGSVVDNEGVAGLLTRCRAKLAKTIMISPVVKRRGKRAVQEVEEEDVESKGDTSRVTRTRASLGKSVVISSPIVMKKRGKRPFHENEKRDFAVENIVGTSRVTRARALLGEKVSTSPVIMKKRVKKAVQEDEKEDLAVENKGAASRVTRARAAQQVLISNPVVMKRKDKKTMQEDEKEDLVVENKGAPSRVTRARAVNQGLISSPVVAEKRGKKAVQKEKKSVGDSSLVVDFTDPVVEEEKEVIAVKILRSRKVENVASPKNITRKRNTQNKSQGVNAEVSENKDAEECITQTRRSKRNRMELTKVEPLEENLDATLNAGRRNITRSRNQFQAKASNVVRESESRDVSEEAKKVVVQVKEPLRRSGRHVNTAGHAEMPIKSEKSTSDQTRYGAKRKSVMLQMKKAKAEKPVADNSGKKNVDPPNTLTKPILIEKGSETGNVRRSERNASGDGSISGNAIGSGTDIKTGTTKKRKRDAVLEEVPSQHTGRRVNRKADNISDKIVGKISIASEPRMRSSDRQNSLMPSARKLDVSGNLRPSRTTGEKASPHHTRELSSMPKHSATGVKTSKAAAVTPGTRSGSGQKSFDHTAKKLRVSDNSELHKSVRDKESPHQSKDILMVSRHSESELKLRGSKSKQTPVINEHPRRFTRSALKGNTDGPARVRGKIYQKKSQSVSKLPLSKVESSLPKVISASEGPLAIDVQLQSSYSEVDGSANILAASVSDLPEDKTDSSTPQGGSEKTCSIDLNLRESEGSELINRHGISSSDDLKLQSDHAQLEVDVSAREQAHAPGERPASHDVHSSIPQIAGCSSDFIFDTSNSCGGLDSSTILQDGATEGNDKTHVHIKPAQGSDVSGDAALIDRNSVDEGFSSLEQIKSKGMEVNPQKVKYVEPSSEGITNVVLDGSTVREEPSMKQLLFLEDGCSIIPLSQTNDVDEDNTDATQPENSCESNVASPHLVHLKPDDAGMDVFPVETNALADISLVDHSTSRRNEERPQLSKDVESISKGIDLNIIFKGSAIHEDEPAYQSPLAEVEEITDNPVTANTDAACVTQQEGPTDIDAKSPQPEITDDPVTANSDSACLTQQEGPPGIDAKSSPLVQIESVDNVDIIGNAGSISAGTVLDNLFNVEQMNSSAIKEKLEVSKNENSVVDGSTVNEERLTAEVSSGVTTGLELGICNPSAESFEPDKDSRSAFKELDEASYADLNNHTVSMISTEEKDDSRHPEISEQADELNNTSSKLGMQENELLVPNSIQTNEEVSISKYEFSKQEIFDTVMCSNKESVDDSNQRLSAAETCLMREESCTNKCVEFSTSVVVADLVSGGNNKPEPEPKPKDPSLPLYVTEVGNLVVDVNEELKPEDSPLNWSSDMSEREAIYGSSLQKEQKCSSLHKDDDNFEHNQPECGKDESEIMERVNMLDSTPKESTDMPEHISVPQTSEHNNERNCTENNLSSSSISEKKIVAFEVDTKLTSEGQEYQSIVIGGKEEETVLEDIKENDSERTSSMYDEAYNTLDVEGEWDLENFSLERTPVISEEDIDRDGIVRPVIVHKFPSSADDHCHTPSHDSCGKEQGTDMSMVKSSRNFGTECFSEHDICHRQEDSCAKEQGAPMSMVKSSKNCGEGIPSQHDNVIEHVNISGADTLPQAICEYFAGSDNQMVADLTGSTGRRISRTGALDNEKLEETDPCTEIADDTVLEEGIELLKESFSNRYSKDPIDSHRSEDVLQQFDMNDGETDNLQQLEETEPCTVIADDTVLEEGIELLKESFSNRYSKDPIDSHRSEDVLQQFDMNDGETDNLQQLEETEPCTVTADDTVLEEGIELLKESFSNRDSKDPIDSHRSEDVLQQFDINDGETDSNLERICQENDESPIQVQIDVDTNNVENSRDNIIAIQECDQEIDASEALTKKLQSYDDAMDSDALVNLQYGGERVTSTEQTNEAQGVCRKELPLPGIEDANAPANLQYGHGSLTLSGETNEDQEHDSRFDKMVAEEDLHLWYEDTSFISEKQKVAEKEVDMFTVSTSEEQPHNSGEEHAREKGPESIENQRSAFIYSSAGDADITMEFSPGESNFESETNRDAHQKVDSCHDTKFDDDFTRNEG